ncbi:MAG: hypothetical protein Q9227_006886 [Pyrenula ochraceoflavens]
MAATTGDKLFYKDPLAMNYSHLLFEPSINWDSMTDVSSESEDSEDSEGFQFSSPDSSEIVDDLHSVATMIQEPEDDRNNANIRFYCDNDLRDLDPNGTTRWKLKPDPAPPFVADYIPQQQRPMPHLRPEIKAFYQEWYDADNWL